MSSFVDFQAMLKGEVVTAFIMEQRLLPLSERWLVLPCFCAVWGTYKENAGVTGWAFHASMTHPLGMWAQDVSERVPKRTCMESHGAATGFPYITPTYSLAERKHLFYQLAKDELERTYNSLFLQPKKV